MADRLRPLRRRGTLAARARRQRLLDLRLSRMRPGPPPDAVRAVRNPDPAGPMWIPEDLSRFVERTRF